MEDVLNLRKRIEEKEDIKDVPSSVPDNQGPKEVEMPPEETSAQDGGRDSLSWVIPARKKSRATLFLGLALILAGGLIWGFMGDPLFGLVLIVGGLIFALGLNHRSEETITIDGEGITTGTSFYAYNQIDFFSINTLPNNVSELCLKLKSWYMPLVRIPIYSQDPIKVGDIMLVFASEKDLEYSWLDIISSRLGF